jgi:glycosyltransferase involved in cell wall biosynthesis
MYPSFDGDYRGIFIHQMVKDLESRGVTVKKAVKTSPSPFGYIPFCYESFHLARDHELDLLQAEYIPHSSLIPALFKRSKVPIVLKFHGDDARVYPFKNPINLALTRSMLNRADHVITASEEMRRIILGIGIKPEKITSIHTGVDTTFFSPVSQEACRNALGVLPEKTLFLFVGRLHPWKGIGEIIEIARRCPDFLFVFVGPGTVPSHPDNCLFVGSLPPEKVRLWLNAADCLLLPTYTEAVPAAVMEAFSCEIPAIATDIGGCPEIVKDGKNGLLVPVRDVEKLHSAVLWMHYNPESRREMGKLGRITVINNFDHSLRIDQLMQIHQNLIEKK